MEVDWWRWRAWAMVSEGGEDECHAMELVTTRPVMLLERRRMQDSRSVRRFMVAVGSMLSAWGLISSRIWLAEEA